MNLKLNANIYVQLQRLNHLVIGKLFTYQGRRLYHIIKLWIDEHTYMYATRIDVANLNDWSKIINTAPNWQT